MSRVDRYEYDDNWKGFGYRVKTYRTQIGLTTEKFSEMINRSENYVNELEKGHKGCSVHTLYQISKALKVSSDSLLFGETVNMKKEYKNKEVLKEIIERCNDEELEVIKDLVTSVYPHLKGVIEKRNQKDKC